MRMKKIILSFFFFAFVVSIHATSISVRILTTKVIQSFIFSPITGTYDVYGDGVLLLNSDTPGIFQLTIDKDSIILKTFERTIGKYASLKMLSKQTNGAFKIKSVVPEGKVRTYEDDVTIGLTADKKQFLLINKIDIEKYIGGVVESESGTRTSLEYYKLQSIFRQTAHPQRCVGRQQLAPHGIAAFAVEHIAGL